MAERVGFEPTIPLTVYTLSKRAPRTLRHKKYFFLNNIESEQESTVKLFGVQLESKFRTLVRTPERESK